MQHPTAFLTLRPHAEGRPEDAALADFPLEERILVVLAHQQWASASDLAKRLDVSDSDIHKACHELEKNKHVAGREMGVTRRMQRRYVLTRQSVLHVTRPFQHKGLIRAALPLTWQMTEEGVTKMQMWLPMIESLYEILPTFWTGGMAEPFRWQSMYPDPSCSSYVWLGVPTLTEVRWLPRGRLHAVATWRFEDSPRRPRSYSIPFFWAGLLPQEDYRSRSLRLGSKFIRSPRYPKDPISWDIEPPVAAIGLDEFAAFRSRTAYGDDVQVGAVDTAGALVWSAEASHNEWTLGEKPPQARSIGHPEAAAIGEGPDLVNLGGRREYRLFDFVAEFRAATRANLVRAFHLSGGAATASTTALTDRGLVTSEGRNLYVTQRGREMLAARDRVDAERLVEVTHLDPKGADAIRERRHDSAVAETAAAFRGAGIPVVAGWRWVVSWHDGQLVPDLWVQAPVPGREEGIWVAVEVEFSAKTEKRIEEKYRSYRLAPIRLGRSFPILVITGEELPAKRFDDLAGDLPVLTTTLKEILTGVWEGPESVWRRRGRPVGLSDFAMEHSAPHLRQPTGRSLDYGKPASETWARLIGKEFMWSDPQTEDLDWEPPPMDRQPQAKMDRVLNEVRAEPPANKPVSAPTPPTPPPAPVGKAATAQDHVLHETPAVPPASRPLAAPAPPAPSPATAQDRPRKRWEVLSKINSLVDEADRIAKRRLGKTDLTDAERLCLQRVRAIITYGAAEQLAVAEHVVEKMGQDCLKLKDQHHHAVRSGNALWSLTMSPTKTDPRQAFKDILKEHPNTRQDACKKFEQWSKVVDRAIRTARKARTLESDDPSGGSAP